jgi:hypothetical protein
MKDCSTIDWSEFEPTIKSTGLPTQMANKPSGKPQRIARNFWLIPSEESTRSLAAIQQLSEKFQLEFSAFTVSGEIESMTK